MIEIVFSDSACGSLKAAGYYGKGKYHAGCISVVVGHTDGSKTTQEEIQAVQRREEEKARPLWENAIPMEQGPADVFSFALAHSIGDVAKDGICENRLIAMERLFGTYPDNVGQSAAGKLFDRARENLKVVFARTAAGEALRIWYSNQPDELCGLYWFMAQLIQGNALFAPVAVVIAPPIKPCQYQAA